MDKYYQIYGYSLQAPYGLPVEDSMELSAKLISEPGLKIDMASTTSL